MNNEKKIDAKLLYTATYAYQLTLDFDKTCEKWTEKNRKHTHTLIHSTLNRFFLSQVYSLNGNRSYKYLSMHVIVSCS